METNPDPRRPVPTVCRILYSNVLVLAGNLSDLTLASSQCDTLLCSATLVPDMRHVSELLVLGFGRHVSLHRGKLPRARGMATYTYVMVTEHFANPNVNVVVKCWISGFVV